MFLSEHLLPQCFALKSLNLYPAHLGNRCPRLSASCEARAEAGAGAGGGLTKTGNFICGLRIHLFLSQGTSVSFCPRPLCKMVYSCCLIHLIWLLSTSPASHQGGARGGGVRTAVGGPPYRGPQGPKVFLLLQNVLSSMVMVTMVADSRRRTTVFAPETTS